MPNVPRRGGIAALACAVVRLAVSVGWDEGVSVSAVRQALLWIQAFAGRGPCQTSFLKTPGLKLTAAGRIE